MSEILTIRQAAQLLNVSDDTIRRLIREDNRLNAFKVRGQYRVDKETLMRVLKTPERDEKIKTALQNAGYSESETAIIVNILDKVI